MNHRNYQKFFLSDLPLTFLDEVALRVSIAYVVVFTLMKIFGRCGVQQLSPFEMVILLTLGSASGDVTFFDDMPVLHVIMVFIVLLMLYRATTRSMSRFSAVTRLIKSEVITLVSYGRYLVESPDRLNICPNEFFDGTASENKEHLGQIRLALVEVDGQLSLQCFNNEFIRPDLSGLPTEHRRNFSEIHAVGTCANNYCGSVLEIDVKDIHRCARYDRVVWSVALNNPRTN